MARRPVLLAAATAILLPVVGLAPAGATTGTTVTAPTVTTTTTTTDVATEGSTEPETVTGEVQRLAVELRDGGGFQLTFVVPTEGDPVRVPDEEIAEVTTGSTVEVVVVGVDPLEEITEPETSAELLAVDVLTAAPEANVLAEATEAEVADPEIAQAPGVVAVRPVHLISGRLSGQTLDAIRSADLATDLTTLVTPYWSDSTAGQVVFSESSRRNGAVHSTWGKTTTCTNSQILGTLAWASALVGLPRPAGDGQHAVLYTPDVAACGFSGVAHVANGGAAWLNGDTKRSSRWMTFAHELGHTLTLGHSNSYVYCGDLADGDECLPGEYGDAYDIMGVGTSAGPLSGAHLQTLGLLDSASTVSASGSTTVALAPVGGLTGTRFLTFTSGGVTYHVEYRAAVGRDADLATNRGGCALGVFYCTGLDRYTPGVVVRRVDSPGAGADTLLLDAGVEDPAYVTSEPWFVLKQGRTFTTADGGAVVKVTAQSSGSATVALTIGPNLRPGTPTISALSGTVTDDTGRFYTQGSTTTISWSVADGPAAVQQQVLRNGNVVATLAPGVRTADIALSKGANYIVVRAVGEVSTALSHGVSLTRDSMAPTFPQAPQLAVRTGVVSTTAVPVTLTWKAADSTLRDVSLVQPAGRAATYKPTTTSAQYVVPRGSRTWELKARDWSGRTTTSSMVRDIATAPETSTSRTGTWRTASNTQLLGGKALVSDVRGSTMSYKFTGRSVGWVVQTGPDKGRATVYVDGKKIGTVDTHSPSQVRRNIVWTHSWATSGTHTVKIVVQGTAGRPRVVSDGFVVLR
ncbi:hypothetical protein J4G33_15240 [Actinotalea sp. BY-33]|uniref:Gametolysin peptidase M11 n=1 Tax=Actinotalea soli TaxID=2819234 RepID=A0A939LS78_9CELL|nr:hypothetical protein [Actinotalea soli]MBO1753164.1 hypothetical protein [Actinotalea soli]